MAILRQHRTLLRTDCRGVIKDGNYTSITTEQPKTQYNVTCTNTTFNMAAVEANVSPAVDVDEDEEQREIRLMKQRVEEMEMEAKKLREMQAAAEENSQDTSMDTEEDKAVSDGRSIYVGNVDYSATPEEIQAHFQACGTINRVTILCDKFTGHPKGYAYVEFAEPEHIDAALAMDNSLFKGRLIKVTAKRTNVPGFNRRGRGYRGGHRGGYRGYNPYYSRPRARGRGRGFY